MNISILHKRQFHVAHLPHFTACYDIQAPSSAVPQAEGSKEEFVQLMKKSLMAEQLFAEGVGPNQKIEADDGGKGLGRTGLVWFRGLCLCVRAGALHDGLRRA